MGSKAAQPGRLALARGGAGAASGSRGRDSLAAARPSGGDSVLGIRIPADVAHGALLATLTLLGGMLLVALLIADAAGIGPRHAAWRARWSYRLPWQS